jgi:translocation and assembly module TamB
MNVSLSGMEGTFSSSAKVEKIDISDADGIWLSIENAELDWTRSALLRKQIEISNLSAGKITFLRKPLENDKTKPEARSFRIPELPLGIKIDTFSADELVVGSEILGVPTRFKLDGRVLISNEDLNVSLNAQNLDNAGIFNLSANINSETKTLDISLDSSEPENGLLVNLLGIPNKPALALQVNGEGPLSSFETNFRMATNNTERLVGQALVADNETDGVSDGIQILLDAKGDLAPLFQDDYKRFFDQDSYLNALVRLRKNGEISISNLSLDLSALDLKGKLDLAADRTPTFIAVEAHISDRNGVPILLPISGAQTYITSGNFALDYDPDVPWYIDANVQGLERDGMTIQNVQFYGFGEIPQPFVPKKTSDLLFSANLEATLTDISIDDPALSRAVGNTVNVTSSASFNKDEPITISDLTVNDGNVQAHFQGQIQDLETALRTLGKLDAKVEDLSVFSSLVGQNLDGVASFSTSGSLALLTGSFDLEGEVEVEQVATGSPTLNLLLPGPAKGTFSVARTESGIDLEFLDFTNNQFNASVNGSIQSNIATINLSSNIYDLNTLSSELSGGLITTGTLVRTGDTANVDLKSTGIAGLRANIFGKIPLTGKNWDVDFNGQVPLALADPYLDTSGVRARGDLDFALNLNGRPSLQNLSGRVSTLAASLVLPEQDISLRNVNASADINSGIAKPVVTANLASGGNIAIDGEVTIDDTLTLNSNLNINLNNVVRNDQNFYTTTLNGKLNLGGPLTIRPKLTGQINLSDTEVNLQSNQSPTVSFLPDIIHNNDKMPVRKTRKRAGISRTKQATATSTAIDLDISVDAPARVFIRGRGLDAELGGTMRLQGDTRSVEPIGAFNLIRGRLDLLGKRLALNEASITMAGALNPRLRVVATSNSDEFDMSVVISGLVSDPTITFSSVPALPEDEILVRMFFGRSLNEISAFQALQLAAAVRELTGTGGTSFLQRVRGKLGVDDFSIATTNEGTTEVSAGKYISENVYTDVNVASDGQTEITINLDINDNVSATGSVSDSGESKVGIFFKKDF